MAISAWVCSTHCWAGCGFTEGNIQPGPGEVLPVLCGAEQRSRRALSLTELLDNSRALTSNHRL